MNNRKPTCRNSILILLGQRCYFVVALFLCSCDLGVETNYNSKSVTNAVFICNEGNFMSGNASLSVYDPQSKEVQNDLYSLVNKVPIGDVCQSMSIINGKGFVVVNNSAKVIVIDLDTYKHLGKIQGLSSPRYIEQIDADKLYITDLYSNQVAIANPNTLKVTGSIYIGKGTEQMVRYDDYVYACGWSFNNQVYRIDTRTDKLIDSVTVTKQPNSMVIDKNNKIWVLSDGGYTGSPYGQVIPALTRIDARTFKVEKVIEFPTIDLSPSELAINGSRDTIYYISGNYAIVSERPKKSGVSISSNGVYKMSVGENELPASPIIPEDGRLLYGLAIDPNNSEIYLTDAIDYQQQGFVLRYTPKGELIDKFKTDITPGAFCFR